MGIEKVFGILQIELFGCIEFFEHVRYFPKLKKNFFPSSYVLVDAFNHFLALSIDSFCVTKRPNSESQGKNSSCGSIINSDLLETIGLNKSIALVLSRVLL